MSGPLRNQSFRGEHIVIQDDGKARVPLGPNLHFIDCELEFRASARSVSIADVSLVNCSIRAARKLEHVDFYHARLESCRFAGTFVDCDFGRFSRMDPDGHIADCDFSQAVLDDCRFFGCDMETLVLPTRWPQVVFERFQEEARQLLLGASNVDRRIFLQLLAEESPEVVAVCTQAKTVAKRLRIDVSEVAAVLRQLPFAKLPGDAPA